MLVEAGIAGTRGGTRRVLQVANGAAGIAVVLLASLPSVRHFFALAGRLIPLDRGSATPGAASATLTPLRTAEGGRRGRATLD
ncbi:MAG: hypothetical protein WC709_09675 [Thermoleophilia bacterium]